MAEFLKNRYYFQIIVHQQFLRKQREINFLAASIAPLPAHLKSVVFTKWHYDFMHMSDANP